MWASAHRRDCENMSKDMEADVYASRGKRLWMLMELLWHETSQTRLAEMAFTEIRIKAPPIGSNEVMVIVKLREEGRQYVGFSSAARANDALLQAMERAQNGAMKWREDHPYQPPA